VYRQVKHLYYFTWQQTLLTRITIISIIWIQFKGRSQCGILDYRISRHERIQSAINQHKPGT